MRGSSLRFSSWKGEDPFSSTRISLSRCAKRAGEERARSSWLATRHFPALGAVRSSDCSVGSLCPSPFLFLPSLPRPLSPPLLSI